MHTREEYEKLINNAPLFEVDRQSSPALYSTERSNFLIILTEYYKKYVYVNRPLEEYDLTLVLTADECIKGYHPEKGLFLHLFNSVLSRNVAVHNGKEMTKQLRQGIKVSDADDRLWRKIINFAKSRNADIDDESVRTKIAKALFVAEYKMEELWIMSKEVKVGSNVAFNADNEEINLFDIIPSDLPTAEEVISNKSVCAVYYEVLAEEFEKLQNRQKRLIAYCLTADILKGLNCDVNLLAERISNKPYFSKGIVNYYERSGEVPTHRRIADEVGILEAALSRAYNGFKQKLSKRIKEIDN